MSTDITMNIEISFAHFLSLLWANRIESILVQYWGMQQTVRSKLVPARSNSPSWQLVKVSFSMLVTFFLRNTVARVDVTSWSVIPLVSARYIFLTKINLCVCCQVKLLNSYPTPRFKVKKTSLCHITNRKSSKSLFFRHHSSGRLISILIISII